VTARERWLAWLAFLLWDVALWLSFVAIVREAFGGW
jgi:hypothetical protein